MTLFGHEYSSVINGCLPYFQPFQSRSHAWLFFKAGIKSNCCFLKKSMTVNEL